MTKLWLPSRRRIAQFQRTPLGVFSAGATIAPPVMTWTSAANITTPVFGIATPATALAGNLIQVQASQSSGFSAPEYDDTHELSAGEISGLAFAPLVGPLVPGLWYARSRWNQGVGWSAWSNIVSLTINTYVGLGDVRASALGYWGCQAYSSAFTVGANCIELRRASDNAAQIFTLQYDGRLDLSAIAIFRDAAGASTVYVKTLYGQNIACNLTQATNSKQPEFILNDPVGWGAIKFVRANSQMLEGSSSGIASAAPYHMMAVFHRTGTFTSYSTVFGLTNGGGGSPAITRIAPSNAANEGVVYTGSGSAVTATNIYDGIWNTVQTTINGASSRISVESTGTTYTGTTSTDALVSGVVRIGGLSDGVEHFDGRISEVCVWSGAPGASGEIALAANSLDRLLVGY